MPSVVSYDTPLLYYIDFIVKGIDCRLVNYSCTRCPFRLCPSKDIDRREFIAACKEWLRNNIDKYTAEELLEIL